MIESSSVDAARLPSAQDGTAKPKTDFVSGFEVICHPHTADFGVAYPGQLVIVSLLVWRSDGKNIGQFDPLPDGLPDGLTLHPSRQDARHCRVDVTWLIPEIGLDPGPHRACFGVLVDGKRGQVHVRLRLMPARSAVGKLADRLVARKRLIPLVAALLLGAAAVTGLLFSHRFKAVPPVKTPLRQAARQARRSPFAQTRVLAVQHWRGMALWHVTGGRILVDKGSHHARVGDVLLGLKTSEAELPAALILAGNAVPGRQKRLLVDSGRERTAPVPARIAMLSPVAERRERFLEQVSHFLQSETQHARENGGAVERSDALYRYRERFREQTPFRDVLVTWHMRLAGQTGAGRLTAQDMATLDVQARLAHTAIRANAPLRPSLPGYAPLTDALILGAADTGASLRTVATGDNGAFYALSLAQPIRYQGHLYNRLLSLRPFESAPSLALPRCVAGPTGVTRVLAGSLPDSSHKGTALLIPGTRVVMSVVEEATLRTPRPVVPGSSDSP